MAKNGAENGAAPKAKIAKKVGRRTKCTEDYVPRFLERIEAGQSVPAAAAVAGLHISTVMEWLAREWENPVILAQSTVPPQPGKATFHNPGQTRDFERSLSSLDDP